MQFCLFAKVEMQREKRKDMPEHIRAFSMPQMGVRGQTPRAAIFLAVNALEKLENNHISCVLPPVLGQKYLPQNG
jgi:hypothetical protein